MNTVIKGRAAKIFEERNRVFRILYDTIFDVSRVENSCMNYKTICSNFRKLCNAKSCALILFDSYDNTILLKSYSKENSETIILNSYSTINYTTISNSIIKAYTSLKIGDQINPEYSLVNLLPQSVIGKDFINEKDKYIHFPFINNDDLIGIAILELNNTDNLKTKDLIEMFLNMSTIILQRIRANDEIKKSNERFTFLFENSPIGMILVDGLKKVVTINSAALKLINSKESEIIGKKCCNLFCSPNKETCPLNKKGDIYKEREILLCRQGKNPVHVLKSVSPINIAGKLYLIETMIDLTELLKAKEDKKELSKQVLSSEVITIYALAELAESRDKYTGNHIYRVGKYSKLIAEELDEIVYQSNNLNKNDFVNCIELASVLHDIGKVSIPDSILLNPGPLTKEEFEKMKKHTVYGSETLKNVQKNYPKNTFINMGIKISRSHHERYDGNGYPDGLKGKDIPLSARILSVVDVYDALRSERPYKPSFSHEKSIAIIKAGYGSQFDPEIVDTFFKILSNKNICYL